MHVKLSLEDVGNILKAEMPFIEASENIWKFYSKTMCKWMHTIRLAEFRNEHILKVNVDIDSFDIVTDEAHQKIMVRERKQKGAGKYAKYFDSDKPLTKNALALELARVKNELAANNEKLAVDIKKDKDGVLINTKSTPLKNPKQAGGALLFSTLGQRYSGQNVGSLYSYAKLGNGQIVEGTVSHAFHSPDAEGGKFNSLFVNYKNYSYLGEFSLKGSLTDYTTGGEFEMYGLNGNVVTLSAENAYLITEHTKLFGSLGMNSERKYLDLIDASSFMQNVYADTGVRGQYNDFSWDASLRQGLADNWNWDTAKLLGDPSRHFTTLSVNSEFKTPLQHGFEFSVKSGAQIKLGAHDTPAFSQLYAGGLDRGRAYSTGFVSVQNGAFGKLQLATPFAHLHDSKWQGYAGFDGLRGTTTLDQTINAYSAFAGVRGNWRTLNLDMGVATKIGDQSVKNADDTKFLLTFGYGF